jgi:hypothetical protein
MARKPHAPKRSPFSIIKIPPPRLPSSLLRVFVPSCETNFHIDSAAPSAPRATSYPLESKTATSLHHSLFTIHSSPFTLHHSLFTIHSSPFTLHHSLFLPLFHLPQFLPRHLFPLFGCFFSRIVFNHECEHFQCLLGDFRIRMIFQCQIGSQLIGR